MVRKTMVFFLSVAVVLTQLIARPVAAQMAPISQKFNPCHLRFFSYDNTRDVYSLLLDKGDVSVDIKGASDSVKPLLAYFLTGVVLPDSAFWVNLRPDASQEIIDPLLEKTDVGRIMLEADLQLKKDTAQFTSPETAEGRNYWSRLYKKAEELYGSAPAVIPSITRPWIVPGEVIVRESAGSAYIYKADLKVMLEQDYLKGTAVEFKDEKARILNEYSSQLIRELVMPRIALKVNTDRSYAAFRQVYYSLVLARWFKLRFRGKAGVYAALIDSKDLSRLSSRVSWSKETYYNRYKDSFSKGEYDIKEKVATLMGSVIRKYISGGISMKMPQNGFVGEGMPRALLNRPGTLMMGGKAQGLLEAEPIKNRDGGAAFRFLTLEVNKDLQGLDFNDVEKAIASGKTAIAEVSVDWARKIKESFSDEVYTIFIAPLSDELIRQSMLNGKTWEQVIIEEMEQRQAERALELPTPEDKQRARATAAVKEMGRRSEYDKLIENTELKDLKRDEAKWAGKEGAAIVREFMDAVEAAEKSGKKLILYSGPSATGKSPLWRQIQDRYPDKFSRIVLYTTRAMRPGEEEGVDYHFRSIAQLKALESGVYVPDTIAEANEAIIATLREIKNRVGYNIFTPDINREKVREALMGEGKPVKIGGVVFGYDTNDAYEHPVTVGFAEGRLSLNENYDEDDYFSIIASPQTVRPKVGTDGGAYIPVSADEAYDSILATLLSVRNREKNNIYEPHIDRLKVQEAFESGKLTKVGTVVYGYDVDYSASEEVFVDLSRGILAWSEDGYYNDVDNVTEPLERPNISAVSHVGQDSKGGQADGGVKKTGGIDFRTLPLNIQPVGNFKGLDFSMAGLNAGQLRTINVKNELHKIGILLKSGNLPSSSRVKELAFACALKKDRVSSEVLLLVVADALKLEQETCRETSSQEREALAIVDWLAR